jgi:hypothetical protein
MARGIALALVAPRETREMHKDPLAREREFRQMIERSANARRIAQSPRLRFLWWLRSLAAPIAPLIKRLRLTLVLIMVSAFGVLFLLIFGVSIKWTDAYACSLAEARRSPAVIAELGEPIEAGFFAWVYAYSQQASVTDAWFRTTLAGPKGGGTLRVW